MQLLSDRAQLIRSSCKGRLSHSANVVYEWIQVYFSIDQDMVTYRLDKMENVKVEEAEREPHPEYELFNTEEYRKQVFSMFGGETQKVTLLFTPKILSDMFDRYGDDIRIRKIDDNTYTVDVAFRCRKRSLRGSSERRERSESKLPKRCLRSFQTL